jgi:branched-chain amino acid transport system substrate-binding protein
MRKFLLMSMLLAGVSAMAHAESTEPVRIGVLNDQSSVYSAADGSGSILAAKIAVEDFGGKVLGRPIEIVPADHQNKADIGATIAREWIERDHVSAIAEGGNSSVAFAVQEIVRDRDAAFLNVNGTSSELSNKACTPKSVYWGIDTFALAKSTGTLITKAGGDTWYFITADYTFGHTLENDTTKMVTAAGGKVLGAATHPLNNADFASQLLQAQKSGAKVIAFADAGTDFSAAMKQASEFGMTSGGQKLVGLMVFVTDIEAMGLKTAQGLQFASLGEWNSSPATMAWSRKFMARYDRHMPPVPGHIGFYSVIRHYLEAVQATGTLDAKTVVAQMKEMPLDDFYSNGARVRGDGRLMADVHVVSVKKSSAVTEPFDYFEDVAVIKGVDAFRPAAESQCSLLKQ